jgi:predicted molibdopterin-dependent oxidoreductase YjgC
MKYENISTVCPYCGTGCNFYLEIIDGEITGVIQNKTDVLSQGRLCIKGWNAAEFVNHPDRLTKPLIKKDGKFVEATWAEAVSLVASKFTEYIDKFGANSLGGLASAKVTNEENFVFQKFMRAVIGTNNVDHCARL